ncbi:hypothetical protein BJ742DRAFT_71244 [Cladochytrium replicatum]|nr:hypothetical protein BJ742DRAFT_71244 [Cladochytrium replicatum]
MPSTTVTKTTSILPSGQWIYASAVAESTAYSMSVSLHNFVSLNRYSSTSSLCPPQLNYNVAVSTGSIYAMMLKPEDYSTFKESTDDVPKSFLFLDTITPSAVQTGRFTSALEPGTYTMLFYCPFAARVNCTSVSANAFWTFLPGTPTNWGGSAAITGGSAPTGSGSGNPSVGSSASGDLSVGAIVGIAIGGIAGKPFEIRSFLELILDAVLQSWQPFLPQSL